MSSRNLVLSLGAAVLIVACGSSSPAPAGPSAADGIALASCMRAHGLTDFPDPNPGHGMQFSLPAGLTPNSPAFRSAQGACRHLVPPAARGGGGASTRIDAGALAFARCMRSHGVPNYPDPTYHGGRPTEQPPSAYGINPDAPAVQHAEKACGAP